MRTVVFVALVSLIATATMASMNNLEVVPTITMSLQQRQEGEAPDYGNSPGNATTTTGPAALSATPAPPAPTSTAAAAAAAISPRSFGGLGELYTATQDVSSLDGAPNPSLLPTAVDDINTPSGNAANIKRMDMNALASTLLSAHHVPTADIASPDANAAATALGVPSDVSDVAAMPLAPSSLSALAPTPAPAPTSTPVASLSVGRRSGILAAAPDSNIISDALDDTIAVSPSSLNGAALAVATNAVASLAATTAPTPIPDAPDLSVNRPHPDAEVGRSIYRRRISKLNRLDAGDF